MTWGPEVLPDGAGRGEAGRDTGEPVQDGGYESVGSGWTEGQLMGSGVRQVQVPSGLSHTRAM